TINSNEDASIGEHLDERCSLFGIHFLAVADHCFSVVCASFELSSFEESLDHCFGICFKEDHSIKRSPDGCKHLVERMNLFYRARVAIEEEPLSCIILLKTIRYDFVGQSIGNQFSSFDDFLHPLTEFGLSLYICTEDIAG